MDNEDIIEISDSEPTSDDGPAAPLAAPPGGSATKVARLRAALEEKTEQAAKQEADLHKPKRENRRARTSSGRVIEKPTRSDQLEEVDSDEVEDENVPPSEQKERVHPQKEDEPEDGSDYEVQEVRPVKALPQRSKGRFSCHREPSIEW
ncbi:hypothetical protein HYDPIDRAFT_107474 [Hydnomerulius pinastri MD-312]|nr:hypothetical protein HYDPIDRAFT_107474 [Hydnomerulius pinastri MD-312]